MTFKIKSNPKRPKTKASKKKRKKESAAVIDKPVLPASISLSEGAEEFYDIIAKIYRDADDSAIAAAKFESDLISYYVAENENGQEIPDEFKRGSFQEMHGKLLELRALKDFSESFNLGAYLPEIMSTRIAYLFGGGVGGKNTKARRPSAFFGGDEEYLIHTLREKIRSGR